MTELFLLGIFSATLVACVATGVPILFALAFGLIIFSAYALEVGHSPRKVVDMWLDGVRPIKTMLLTFLLIGVLTAYWRAAGVIGAIIFYTADFFTPAIMLLMSFWLCALVSVLTGTAFGTGATMGVICAATAESFGVPLWLTGGAILSGAYFGDRCSPMSTSALLVATLTRTDIFRNLGNMIRTSIIPFASASLLYLAAGIFLTGDGAGVNVKEIFAQAFEINVVVLVPAALIVVLSLLRIRVQLTMIASILACAVVAVNFQGASLVDLLKVAVIGFVPADGELARILSGGGIVSMANVTAIVCLSSCYAGIFKATGFLNGLQKTFTAAGKRFSPFASVLAASIVTAMVACNQTLSIMLTHQLCAKVEPRAEVFALHLENSAVIISPLVPWSIACAVPFTLIGAPVVGVLAAWYLWLLPACSLRSCS